MNSSREGKISFSIDKDHKTWAMFSVKKIISGGQTGADRAALDSAILLGMQNGGWLPPGRMTEEGALPLKYSMDVMLTGGYPERTRKNVMEADGTLILSHGELTGGSALTQRLADRLGKPCLHLDFHLLSMQIISTSLKEWLEKYNIEVLNIAGARASSDAHIYEKTRSFLLHFFSDHGSGHLEDM